MYTKLTVNNEILSLTLSWTRLSSSRETKRQRDRISGSLRF